MTDLFLRILNLSFSATWVVLAVVIARLLLKKAPRRLICALWRWLPCGCSSAVWKPPSA